MNWEQYLKDVFTTFRQEFNKLNEEEKTLAQLNTTFSQPCQIEVLEFLKPRCNTLIVTFYEDFPDMEIIVYHEIAEDPERFVQRLAEEKEKWKRFNPQQLQNAVQAMRNCSKGKHWAWSYISERACVYTKTDFEELCPKEFALMKMNEVIQHLNVKKRDKEMENVVPIPIELIPKDNGRALIKFSLPFELVENGDYPVAIKGHTAKISIRNISVKGQFESITGFKIAGSGGGSVKLTDDTRGVSTISQVEILIPYVTDEIYFLQLALEYLNRLLDVWRFVTGKFWLKESVSGTDVISMHWEKRRPSGKGQRGMFAFGLPGHIRVSTRIRKTSDVLPQILKCLADETYIPLFQILKLNALNHYTERRYDLAIVESNIALEDFTMRYLAKRLSQKDVPKEEILRKLSRYDRFHKMLDRGLKDILGHSLKENAELWNDFNRMRAIRKNAIHPFVAKSSYEEATDVINIANKIAQWISQK